MMTSVARVAARHAHFERLLAAICTGAAGAVRVGPCNADQVAQFHQEQGIIRVFAAALSVSLDECLDVGSRPPRSTSPPSLGLTEPCGAR